MKSLLISLAVVVAECFTWMYLQTCKRMHNEGKCVMGKVASSDEDHTGQIVCLGNTKVAISIYKRFLVSSRNYLRAIAAYGRICTYRRRKLECALLSLEQKWARWKRYKMTVLSERKFSYKQSCLIFRWKLG